MEGSPEIMHQAAEVFGVITWLWVFSRARADLPWILGFRHPWDHPEDPFDPNPHGHHGGHESSSPEEQVEAWNKFTMKSIKPGEDDDDDEDEDEENVGFCCIHLRWVGSDYYFDFLVIANHNLNLIFITGG